MSEYLKGTQFNPEFHDGPTVEVRTRVLKELVGTRIQLLGGPYLKTAPDCVNLQVLSDKEWVNWPAVGDILTRRITVDPASGAELDSHHYGLIAYAGGGVAVRIKHLVDDYWWVECLFPAIEDYDEWQASISRGPAVAVLLAEGSGSNLSDTSGSPIWFTAGG